MARDVGLLPDLVWGPEGGRASRPSEPGTLSRAWLRCKEAWLSTSLGVIGQEDRADLEVEGTGGVRPNTPQGGPSALQRDVLRVVKRLTTQPGPGI